MFTPGVIGLVSSSAVVALLAIFASIAGLSVTVGWNPDDSSARQLRRERRALLVESLMGAVLAFQVLIFFLFISTADKIHERLDGAMCAAGSLAASRFGYPLLLLQVAALVLAATWLVVNRATRVAHERRIVRLKHGSLLVVAAVLAAAAVVQVYFFADLDPTVLTSCCATIFAPGSESVASTLAALDPHLLQIAFFATLAFTVTVARPAIRGRLAAASHTMAGLVLAALAVAGLVAWIGPGFYGIETHRCPFCIIAADHHRVGLLLYALIASGLVASLASGALALAHSLDPSLDQAPLNRRSLCRASVASWLLFALLASVPSLVNR